MEHDPHTRPDVVECCLAIVGDRLVDSYFAIRSDCQTCICLLPLKIMTRGFSQPDLILNMPIVAWINVCIST